MRGFTVLFCYIILFTGCKSKEDATTVASNNAPVITEGALTVISTSSNDVTLSWKAAQDTETSAELLVYTPYFSTSDNIGNLTDTQTNGKAAAAGQANSLTANVSGLSPATTYYFNVLVSDADGQKSAYTSVSKTTTNSATTGSTTATTGSTTATTGSTATTTGSTTTTTDSAAPTSPVLNLAAGATSTTSTTITAALSATDDTGVTGYYLSTDPTKPSPSANGWTSSTEAKNFSSTQNITFTSLGKKTYYAWYKDAQGNISTVATDSVLITSSWTAQFGSAAYDKAYSTGFDSAGNLFVSGQSSGSLYTASSSGGNDAFVAKYDTAGNQLWVKQTGTSSGEYAIGMAVASDGTTYLTGYTQGVWGAGSFGGTNDVFVAKIDSSGTQQWVEQIGTSGGDISYGIAVDSSGNYYVVGHTDGTFAGQTNYGGADVFIAKYDASRTLVWLTQWGTALTDVAHTVTLDASRNVYIAGYSGTNALVAKFNSTGTLVWSATPSSTGTDVANGVGVDSSGNVYVAGYAGESMNSQTYTGGNDRFLVKYDTAGALIWTHQSGTATDDRFKGITVSQDGKIYLTGTTDSALLGNTAIGGVDWTVSKFESTGTRVWTVQLGTAQAEEAMDIAIDADGNLAVSGSTAGNMASPQVGAGDIVLIKNPGGKLP